MQYAMTAAGRIKAEPDTPDAWCPTCEATMIAKCGQVISWHWAHQSSPMQSVESQIYLIEVTVVF